MIHELSERISGYVYRHNDGKVVSLEVLRFAVASLLTNLITVLLCIFISLLNGYFQETIAALAAMASLRMLAGGYHIRSAAVCIAVSTLVVIVVPYIHVSAFISYVLLGICIILVALFAPSDLRGKTRISERSLVMMKYAAILVVGSNCIIGSSILSVAFFLASLSLIPYRKG